MNNPKAFPAYGVNDDDGLCQQGMTLRDYFAAKAMQGYVSRTNWPVNDFDKTISGFAYDMADAMLAERAK